LADEPTVKLLLKKPMIGLDGKEMKQPTKLRQLDKYLDMNDKEYAESVKDMSTKAILNLCPANTVGDGIKTILANCIKSKNNEDAAKLFVYISKINNICETTKAEWSVTKDELKKFMDLLETATDNISVVINGQIHNTLEEYYAEIVRLNSNPKK